MGRNRLILLTLAVAFLGVAVPVVGAIYLAHRHELEQGETRASHYARDILERSELTADAFLKIVDRLTAMNAGEPCSERGLDLMEHAALASARINALGYVSGNRLVCSTLGHPFDNFDLGAAHPVGEAESEVTIRTGITFPLTGDTQFTVLEKAGYAGIIHRDVPLSVSTEGQKVLLGIVDVRRGRVLLSNARIEPGWLESIPASGESVALADDGSIIAAARSSRYDLGTVAVIPAVALARGADEMTTYLVPLGGVAGIILAVAVLYFTREHLAFPQVLRSALRRDQFFLVYQPIVDLHSGRWIGAEALMRWQRSNGEVVSPEIFMPVAEESGLMPSMTQRLLELAARDMGQVFEEFPELYLSFNLCAGDIHDDAIVAQLEELGRRTGAGPGNLMIEVTERALTTPELARSVLHELRENGIRTAVDDFGTGYSSLSYIESFELDVLKIDRFFVETATGEGSVTSRKVMLHIIEIAKSLELEMVAEGVETDAQKRFLVENGVRYGQGWLFSKPLKFSEFVTFLRARGVRKKHLALID